MSLKPSGHSLAGSVGGRWEVTSLRQRGASDVISWASGELGRWGRE